MDVDTPEKSQANDLWHELHDLRNEMYERENRQREQRRNDARLAFVGVYGFLIGLIIGRGKRSED